LIRVGSVDAQEIDNTLDELENRLDRLRALYEQYFLGIEKIEPAVARKDVDRRFWVLRRTQIRNTARRFRLQVLVQRYNTFQQYWTRICREIENGTYARHVLKAQKNLGAEPKTWAAKKRLGLLRRGGVLQPNGEPAKINGTSDPDALPGGNADGLVEEPSSLPPAPLESAQNARPKPAPPRAPVAPLTLDELGPLDLDFDDEPTPLPRRPPAPTPAKPFLPSPKGSPPPPAAAPTAAKPPAVAALSATARGAKVPSPATAPSTVLTEERVRKLHAELVETKRKLNQSNAVSVDSLARSLRETEQKLRAQHAGRTIDFQIVVKDGKPVVKPLVRK
jgi:hypothetical protein